MKKHLYNLFILLFPLFIYSQKVEVVGDLLLENTELLGTGINTSMYFKTGDGDYPYTGGIKTIGTSSNQARLGLFTYSSSSLNGLRERMSILDNGNVGIGFVSPFEKLEVAGNVKVAGIISGVSDPISAQDAATKAYVDLLEAQILELQLEMGIKAQDFEGNIYSSVKIGDQRWMAENLRATKYNEGTDIPLVTDGTAWGNLMTPGYCWYDTTGTNYATYSQDTFGAIYNWYAIDTLSNGDKNVCPVDWHVPTDVEWDVLRDFVDPSSNGNNGNNNTAGGKMKEAGLAHWNTPNTSATNESGFAALPGGYRFANGTFSNIGYFGNWWSSTESNTTVAWYRYLYYFDDSVLRNFNDKGFGFSVRCLRD